MRMPPLRHLTLLLCCQAVPAQAMLMDAYRKALTHSPDYLASQAEQEGTAEELGLARSQLLPQLNASASQGVANSKVTVPGPGGHSLTANPQYDVNLWSLQLRQPILRASSIYAYRSSARHVAASAAQMEDTRQELATTLISTLGQLHYAAASLYAARTAADSASQMLNLNLRQLHAGYGTRRDVAAAQTDLAKARKQMADAKLEEATQTAAWQMLTGDSTVDMQLLPEDLAERLPLPISDSAALLAIARDQQPALHAAREELESQRLEVRRAQSEHLPTLDLVASRSHTASNTENTIGNTYLTNRLDLQLNVPLYSGGATQARVRQSQAKLRQVEATLQGVLARTQAQIARSLAGLAQARLQAASSRSAAEAADINLRSAVLGMTAGTATLADKVNADAAHAIAVRDQIQANAEAMVHWCLLQKALGRMDSARLQELTALLGWKEPAPQQTDILGL